MIPDDLREMRIPSNAEENTRYALQEHNKQVQKNRLSSEKIEEVQTKVDHLRKLLALQGKSVVDSNDKEVSSGPLTTQSRKAANSRTSKTSNPSNNKTSQK